MSCNGCRVLRKGCSESCILRPCLQWIESADAQGHATVFVAKFFGRAGLMSFITAVPDAQRPALFQSLLYEACGRTVNPVFGAVGLLWAGNWQVCQAAVETVLKGGSLKAPSSCSQIFSALPQGPLHPGKEVSGAQESVVPSVVTKEHSVDLKARLQRGCEPAAVVVKSSWDVNLQPVVAPAVKGNLVVNSHVIAWPEAPKVGEKRGREIAMGAPGVQVLTPAPRRVKAVEFGALIKDSKYLYDDEETVVGSTEQLDLGLTLMVKDGKGGQITGLKRVYSPSCESVNSEGSVTSLDTTPRPAPPYFHHHHHHHHQPSFSSPGHGDMLMHRKLLPLLL